METITVKAESWDRIRRASAEDPNIHLVIEGVGGERYEFRLLMKDKDYDYISEFRPARQSSGG